MKVSVFGLGYVGAVTASCLAQEGHLVIGVDKDASKVDIMNSGRSPIIEKDIDAIVAYGVNSGRLRATTDSKDAIRETDISLICVGTPSNPNGALDLRYVDNVCNEIGQALQEKDDYHVVVVRSTVLPGTIEGLVIPVLEKTSCKKAGIGFGIASNPEFMRESTSVYDFYNPPKTIIGALGDEDAETVAALYKGINGPLIKTTLKIAEMVKYADNTFHALKVTFGNEIGTICKALGIDSHEVMKIFCSDTKLNLSPYYLKPGFAFGGSCLPKDVRALMYKGRSLDLHLPLLDSIMSSNQQQIRNGIQRILALGKKKIGILGFAFKAGTDDIRESPIVEMIETLLGKGYDIKIYDNNVSLAKLYGANKVFIETKIPHISELMVESMSEIVAHSEVIIIGNKSIEFQDALILLKENQYVLDLVRISENISTRATYDGICW